MVSSAFEPLIWYFKKIRDKGTKSKNDDIVKYEAPRIKPAIDELLIKKKKIL